MTIQQIKDEIKQYGRAETRRNIRCLIRELSRCEGIFSDWITITYTNAMICRCL